MKKLKRGRYHNDTWLFTLNTVVIDALLRSLDPLYKCVVVVVAVFYICCIEANEQHGDLQLSLAY